MNEARSPEAGQGSEDFRELEHDTRQMLLELGMHSTPRKLSDADQRRTDAAARAALEEILSNPRGSTGANFAEASASSRRPPHTAARGRSRARRWIVTGLGIAAAGSLALALVPAIAPLFAPTPRDSDTQSVTDTGGTEASSSQLSTIDTPPIPSFDLDTAPNGLADSAVHDAGEVLERLSTAALAHVATGSTPGSMSEGSTPSTPIQLVLTDRWALSDPTTPSGSPAAIREEHYLLPDGRIRLVVRESTAGSPDARDGTELPTPCRDPAACTPTELIASYADRPLSPSVDAELWSAIKKSGDATYLGRTTDRLSRSAIGLRIPAQDQHHDLIVYADSRTGAYLGADVILTANDPARGLTAPAVVAFTAIVSAEWISKSALP